MNHRNLRYLMVMVWLCSALALPSAVAQPGGGGGGGGGSAPPPNPAIAFNKGGAIYVMNVDGTNVRRVLANAGDYNFLEPAFSPDATKIAFIGTPLGAGSAGLYTVNHDGTGLTLLAPTGEGWGVCAWSPVPAPDGRSKIAYMDYPSGVFGQNESTDIIVINTDGTGRTPITFTEFPYEQHVAWSPDGARLAVTYLIDENDCLVFDLGVNALGDVVATGMTNITDVPGGPLAGRPDGEIQDVDWARGSNRIALSARGQQGHDIWIIDLANPAAAANITAAIDSNSDVDPSWSPDDAKLVVRRGGSGARSGICTINANGTGLRQLAKSGTRPDWRRTP